ncbi:hypothetical protein AgCh_034316 [Apium graveolens]
MEEKFDRKIQETMRKLAEKNQELKVFDEGNFSGNGTNTGDGDSGGNDESGGNEGDSSGHRHLLQDDDDYIVVSNIVVVSQDGTGDFTTIKDALTLGPNKIVASDGYFVIYVTVGVYEEYVYIPNNNKYIRMIGDGINQIVITGNHSTADGLATFNSTIFAVVGQGFIPVNITFRNTAGAVNHQAVAMRSREDMSTFYSCSFEGYQDTLSDTVYVLQVMKERAKNRVDDLQGMFCELQSARKESHTNDVALLEEQVNQMLGEWQSVRNHPSHASSFQDIVFTLVQSGVCVAFSRDVGFPLFQFESFKWSGFVNPADNPVVAQGLEKF